MATRWKVLVGLVLARIAFAFQLQTVGVVAPGLIEGLGFDALQIGTLIGLFSLPGLVLAIPGGILGQWLGERRFLTGCLVAMTAGALLCGWASVPWLLWVGRALAGFGAIGLNVVMSKVVIDWFAGRELATAMALFLVGYPFGIGLALTTLGPLATAAGWPLAFQAGAALALAALAGFLATYRPVAAARPAASRTRLLPRELGMVSLSGLVWALYNAAYMIFVSFLPLHLVAAGMAREVAASLVGVGLWVSLAAGPFGGALVDRIGRATPIILAGLGVWTAGALLSIPLAGSAAALGPVLAVSALFGSAAAAPIVALASEVLRPEARGAGMGVHYTWLYGGIALGPVIGGYASDATGDARAPIFALAGLCALAALVLMAFRLIQRRIAPRVA